MKMRMRATVLSSLFILCAWFAYCAGETKSNDPAGEGNESQVEKTIRSAEKVELFFVPPPGPDKDPAEKFVLETREEVQEFLSFVVLTPKLACKCEHEKMLRFTRGDKKITVSICSHCFDVVDDGKLRTFKMPKELWAKFCEYEKKHKAQEKDK